MEYAFVVKLIHQVWKTYTYGEALVLNKSEEQKIVQEINDLKKHSDEDLIDITHDVVYQFFTGQTD
ncbi:YqzH family protein [Bacillus solitudinis]|uniref:YqzH family protein n=1 Tax=Bacillus solitudinis TaxID=2014074 RepID=UPI000C2417E5|nr:YqzH family protein [Bacillus solitudinis]